MRAGSDRPAASQSSSTPVTGESSSPTDYAEVELGRGRPGRDGTELSLHAVLTDEQLAAEAEGEASRKASREGGSRREAKDEDGEQPRRERRPRRRRMRSAESSEEE